MSTQSFLHLLPCPSGLLSCPPGSASINLESQSWQGLGNIVPFSRLKNGGNHSKVTCGALSELAVKTRPLKWRQDPVKRKAPDSQRGALSCTTAPVRTGHCQVVPCCACMLSHVRLCNPMDCSPPGSSVHGISQAGTLEWVAISSSEDPAIPGIEPTSPVPPALAGEFFTTETPGRRR